MIRRECDICQGGVIDVQTYIGQEDPLPGPVDEPVVTLEIHGVTLALSVVAGQLSVCGPCRAGLHLDLRSTLANRAKTFNRTATVA